MSRADRIRCIVLSVIIFFVSVGFSLLIQSRPVPMKYTYANIDLY